MGMPLITPKFYKETNEPQCFEWGICLFLTYLGGIRSPQICQVSLNHPLNEKYNRFLLLSTLTSCNSGHCRLSPEILREAPSWGLYNTTNLPQTLSVKGELGNVWQHTTYLTVHCGLCQCLSFVLTYFGCSSFAFCKFMMQLGKFIHLLAKKNCCWRSSVCVR